MNRTMIYLYIKSGCFYGDKYYWWPRIQMARLARLAIPAWPANFISKRVITASFNDNLLNFWRWENDLRIISIITVHWDSTKFESPYPYPIHASIRRRQKLPDRSSWLQKPLNNANGFCSDAKAERTLQRQRLRGDECVATAAAAAVSCSRSSIVPNARQKILC